MGTDKKFKIILVMPEPPLPFGGAAARWYYVLLKTLVYRGHSVTAFAACGKQEEAQKAKELFAGVGYDLRCYVYQSKSVPVSKVRSLMQPYSYVFGDELRVDLEKELAQGYDILHLEQLWSGWVALKHRQRAVVNVHFSYRLDRIFQGASSLESFLEG